MLHRGTARTGRLLSFLVIVAFVLLASGPFAPVASADQGQVDRLAGEDRYATAAAISAASFPPDVEVAYVAVGSNYPDALAAAAAAGARHAPVLLVTRDAIPRVVDAELARLRPKRIVIAGSTGVVSSQVEAALARYVSVGVDRQAGDDRYATAAAISRGAFSPGVAVAYVAVGTDFPDALAGAAAAGRNGGPVLLVKTGEIPGPIAAELRRLAPRRIFVLGGPSAVSSAVEAALRGYTAGSVERIAGADRYATAVAISQRTYATADTVYLATGRDFPDALAAAPLRGPLLMSSPDVLPPAVRAEIVRLGASRIVAVGGQSVVPDAIAYAAAALPYSPPDTRRTGNLYDALGVRWQQPNPYACTAAATMMMLNMTASRGVPGPEFTWTPSTSYDLQNEILAWSRQNMTMVLEGTNGTDPHGWRNALNAYGWGSMHAGVYRDRAYGSFDAAVKEAIIGVARYGKPSGLLMLAGKHAALVHGWDVTGDDPATGSANFTVNGVYLTDPWEPNATQNAYLTLAALRSGGTWQRFTPYLETDSPYRDPIDGEIGREEWYGKYVVIVAGR